MYTMNNYPNCVVEKEVFRHVVRRIKKFDVISLLRSTDDRWTSVLSDDIKKITTKRCDISDFFHKYPFLFDRLIGLGSIRRAFLFNGITRSMFKRRYKIEDKGVIIDLNTGRWAEIGSGPGYSLDETFSDLSLFDSVLVDRKRFDFDLILVVLWRSLLGRTDNDGTWLVSPVIRTLAFPVVCSKCQCLILDDRDELSELTHYVVNEVEGSYRSAGSDFNEDTKRAMINYVKAALCVCSNKTRLRSFPSFTEYLPDNLISGVIRPLGGVIGFQKIKTPIGKFKYKFLWGMNFDRQNFEFLLSKGYALNTNYLLVDTFLTYYFQVLSILFIKAAFIYETSVSDKDSMFLRNVDRICKTFLSDVFTKFDPSLLTFNPEGKQATSRTRVPTLKEIVARSITING